MSGCERDLRRQAITDRQVKVLEVAKTGLSYYDISRKLELSIGKVKADIRILIANNYLISKKENCIIKKTFSNFDDVEDFTLVKSLSYKVTEEQKQFISNNHKKMKRTELAKALNIDKLTLNFILFEHYGNYKRNVV